MDESDNTSRTRRRTGLSAVAAAAGMCLFGLFAHSAFPLSLLSTLGLAAVAVTVYRAVRADPCPERTWGLKWGRGVVILWVGPGCVLGLMLGLVHRLRYAAEMLPPRLAGFALVAALIGATEELVYRGYLQGSWRRFGPAWAVAGAAAGHTAYKCSLFVFRPEGVEVSLWVLATFTFLGGLAFGALRERSGSVLPPVAAHVCFDLTVYGGLASAPWWVWT